MTEKLEMAVARYDEINAKLSDPNTVADSKLYAELMKEYKRLTPLIDAYKRYKAAERSLEDAKTACDDDDPELRKMALEEIGLDLGITRERVRQIEGIAMKKLRTSVKAEALRAYR